MRLDARRRSMRMLPPDAMGAAPVAVVPAGVPLAAVEPGAGGGRAADDAEASSSMPWWLDAGVRSERLEGVAAAEAAAEGAAARPAAAVDEVAAAAAAAARTPRARAVAVAAAAAAPGVGSRQGFAGAGAPAPAAWRCSPGCTPPADGGPLGLLLPPAPPGPGPDAYRAAWLGGADGWGALGGSGGGAGGSGALGGAGRASALPLLLLLPLPAAAANAKTAWLPESANPSALLPLLSPPTLVVPAVS